MGRITVSTRNEVQWGVGVERGYPPHQEFL